MKTLVLTTLLLLLLSTGVSAEQTKYNPDSEPHLWTDR